MTRGPAQVLRDGRHSAVTRPAGHEVELFASTTPAFLEHGGSAKGLTRRVRLHPGVARHMVALGCPRGHRRSEASPG
jgi:hypothetical protein